MIGFIAGFILGGATITIILTAISVGFILGKDDEKEEEEWKANWRNPAQKSDWVGPERRGQPR